MSYFIGKNLERKINEFGLRDLDQALDNFTNGQGWVGDQGIATTPTDFGSLRIVVYSMLHKFGIKDEFTIKMIPSRSVIEIRLKTNAASGKQADVFRLDSPNRESFIGQTAPAEPEVNLREKIFGDDLED